MLHFVAFRTERTYQLYLRRTKSFRIIIHTVLYCTWCTRVQKVRTFSVKQRCENSQCRTVPVNQVKRWTPLQGIQRYFAVFFLYLLQPRFLLSKLTIFIHTK
jgi:hypothetical protein